MSDTTPSDLDPTADNAESNPNAGGPEGLAGGMGVSSEQPGQVETNPTGIPPKRTREEGDAVQGEAERAQQEENAGSSLDQPSG